ncbi:hypothetical protein PHMEG_00029237, partial [Phytophthora megakarya]
WWERFQTLAFQGGWSDKMKVYELHLKLSSSARNWRSQLSPHVRRDWTRFSKEFKVKYCKPRLDFLYRLNAAANRADIRFKKSMNDLEYVLKQQGDDWDDDRQSSSSTKARDFRADNLRQGRLRTKYPGRAYVTQSGDESDSDERHVMFEDETLGIPPDPGKRSPSPRYDNPDRDMHCDNRNAIRHHAENCWADLVCENCHRTGHPTQLCKTLPCKKCGKFHDGRCEDWEMLESIARLARQGIVKGLPPPILDRLLAVKAAQAQSTKQNQVKVSGLGGIFTQITASAEVKITLGSRVVYIMELWVAKIGEGLDVLLGMDFMFRAGVCVCIREGLVQRPDEESILMYDENVRVPQSVDLPVTSPENLYLMPGERAREREVVGAGRGDRWVTKIVYQARSWPVAIKVVNVSKHSAWMDMRTPLARIAQYGSFPQAGRFVRPGTRAYGEWQTLILEHAQSEQDRLRAERRESALRDREPPCVPKREYQ